MSGLKAVNGDTYYQDFFILRSEPTNWESKFGGNAWSRFGQTDDYFYIYMIKHKLI